MPGTPGVGDLLGAALAVGDFDGDGFDDLAFGVPEENVGADVDAGVALVAYGAAAGLLSAPVELWSADDFSPLGFSAQDDATLGWSLAAGDFNGDGYDDLAIGAPYYDGSRPDATLQSDSGAVFVLYGSPAGLANTQIQVWQQSWGGSGRRLEDGDHLGSTLAAGDLDGNGFDDLAVGVPGEDVGAVENAGGVNVLYGTAAGLSAIAYGADPVWTQSSFGLAVEAGDQFGARLAIGDFAADGADDLAIAAPTEDLGADLDAGFVVVARGLVNSGLTAAQPLLLSQDDPLLPGAAGSGDALGAALAAGDFDGDGVDDLALGAPGEPLFNPDGEPIVEIGRVYLLHGAPDAGLGGQGAAVRLDGGDLGPVGGFERFGHALAAADFDGDGADELAVGSPGMDDAGVFQAGLAFVFASVGDHAWTRLTVLGQSGGAPGAPAPSDQLGRALAAGDFDGDGFADLAVGAPYDDGPSGLDTSGTVAVFASGTLFRDDFEGGTAARWADAVGD